MEDWQAFFRAIREANPDVIPLAAQSPWAMFNFSYFYAPFANTWIWDTQTNSYVPGFYTQEYSQRIAALRALWDEGLLDPDFMNVNAAGPRAWIAFCWGRPPHRLSHVCPRAAIGADAPVGAAVSGHADGRKGGSVFPALRRQRAVFRIPRAEHGPPFISAPT